MVEDDLVVLQNGNDSSPSEESFGVLCLPVGTETKRCFSRAGTYEQERNRHRCDDQFPSLHHVLLEQSQLSLDLSVWTLTEVHEPLGVFSVGQTNHGSDSHERDARGERAM